MSTTASSEATSDQGVNVVCDSIGRDTFVQSLDCLRPLGMMVNFGSASGPVAAFDPTELPRRGSLIYTRMTLASYLAQPGARASMSQDLFDMVLSGRLRNEARQSYPRADAAQAHRDAGP